MITTSLIAVVAPDATPESILAREIASSAPIDSAVPTIKNSSLAVVAPPVNAASGGGCSFISHFIVFVV